MGTPPPNSIPSLWTAVYLIGTVQALVISIEGLYYVNKILDPFYIPQGSLGEGTETMT